MTSSDETYCSEVEKLNTIRRSSRINRGKKKYWGIEGKENKHKKKNAKVLVKNIKNEDYGKIDWKKSKIVLQKKNHYVEQSKPRKRGRPKKMQHDQAKHVRENLMQWSKQMHKHISGRRIDYQKATLILTELKKIRDVCTTNISNLQVWEKLEHQLNYIVDEHLSSAAIDSINVQNTSQVEIQQSEEWDMGQSLLHATHLAEESHSTLNEQSLGYFNKYSCSQKPLMLDEHSSNPAIDSINVQNTNQDEVQQSERFPQHVTNPAEESQSILNKHSPSFYKSYSCSQQPLMLNENLSSVAKDSTNVKNTNQVEVQQSKKLDRGQFPRHTTNLTERKVQKPLMVEFKNMIQKTEISKNVENVNNHCTTNIKSVNLSESETQCEFVSKDIPNCDSVRQSMNIIDHSYSPDIIPDSQNISSITQPAALKKSTKDSQILQKRNSKILCNKIAKLNISKPKNGRKIKEGRQPQCFLVKNNDNLTFNNNDLLKKLTETGSISASPMNQCSCAIAYQGPLYLINQNSVPTKPNNNYKKKVKFNAPFTSNSVGINSHLISSQTQKKSQTQGLGSVNQTQEFGSENQIHEPCSVNQTQEFGSENQTQELGSVYQTLEFGSENKTQELGSVYQTLEFGWENQIRELNSVNLTQENDSVNTMSQKENLTSNSTPSTSKVLPAPVNNVNSLGWIKTLQQVYKVDPTELTPLSMLPQSFLNDPLANLPTEWEGDFDIW